MMLERFTDPARRVVALAQEEARMLNHNRVGTEHILLGLLVEGDGTAAEALESLGLSLQAVRQQVEELTGRGQHAPSGYIPYAPQAKKVLDRARREALQLGHHHIGVEHILLGLTRESQSLAAQVLAELGADLTRINYQVIQLLAGAHDGEPGTADAMPLAEPAVAEERRLLAEVLSRFDSVDSRLSAVEQRVGTGPDVGDLDQQIAHIRRGKESAIGAEDYEAAAALRDRERQLLAEKVSRQREWATAQLDLPSLAEGLFGLSEEVERLRRLLRRHGIEPRDGAA
jgi:ATP-dependent Clp protease ATP-binding subunit ClpC